MRGRRRDETRRDERETKWGGIEKKFEDAIVGKEKEKGKEEKENEKEKEENGEGEGEGEGEGGGEGEGEGEWRCLAPKPHRDWSDFSTELIHQNYQLTDFMKGHTFR